MRSSRTTTSSSGNWIVMTESPVCAARPGVKASSTDPLSSHLRRLLFLTSWSLTLTLALVSSLWFRSPRTNSLTNRDLLKSHVSCHSAACPHLSIIHETFCCFNSCVPTRHLSTIGDPVSGAAKIQRYVLWAYLIFWFHGLFCLSSFIYVWKRSGWVKIKGKLYFLFLCSFLFVFFSFPPYFSEEFNFSDGVRWVLGVFYCWHFSCLSGRHIIV